MKKSILFLLVGLLFILVSCEEEINEIADKQINIEQFSPVLENGEMKLSGSVLFPKEFNRKTAQIGFFLREYTADYDYPWESFIDADYIYWAYKQDFLNKEEGNYMDDAKVLWVDTLNADGTFETFMIPQIKQYICIAFAINVLESADYSYDAKYQVIISNPFFFTGETTAKLELVNPLWNQFKLTYTSDSDIEVGLCWSATNTLPNVEDNRYRNYDGGADGEQSSIYFDGLDFGDNDVVYLRGYVQKRIENDNYYSEIQGYKMIYSNVIEYRPKEHVVSINTKDDFQEFINSLYIDRGYGNYDYRGDDLWKNYKGTIRFNYEVQKTDWLDINELTLWGDTVYLKIRDLKGTIEGKGTLAYVESVSSTGKISGMTLDYCDRNYGSLEYINNLSIYDNYGNITNSVGLLVDYNHGVITNSEQILVSENYNQIINSKKLYVYNNRGLVENCKDVHGQFSMEEHWHYNPYIMVHDNQPSGKIVNCTIETVDTISTAYICGTNYGYIEKCLPDSTCCITNYGIIKQ